MTGAVTRFRMLLTDESHLLFGVATALVTLLALVIRIVTLQQAWVHTDEPASLLAVQMVWEKGYPLYPSGVLYLQGAVLSYLAAPLAGIFSDQDLYQAVSTLNIVLGLTLIPLTMGIAKQVSGSVTGSVIAGVLVACDPTINTWGMTIRPYGLLMVETAALLFLVIKYLQDGPGVTYFRVPIPVLITMVAVAGTFTHIGFWLVAPGLALIVGVILNKSLLTTHRLLAICGTISLLAPASFILLGKFVGVGNGTAGSTAGESFVGSHLFSLGNLVRNPTINWNTWIGAFNIGTHHQYIPHIVLISSAILLLTAIDVRHTRVSRSILVLLAAHWSVVLIVCVFVVIDPRARYLIQALPLAYVITGAAVVSIWRAIAFSEQRVGRFARLALICLVALPSVSFATSSAEWRMETPGIETDYWNISRWVGERYRQDQAVIIGLPPTAYFWFPKTAIENDMYFLAGPEGSDRTRRYVKTMDDGSQGDYWLGIPPIASVGQLCDVLEQYAGRGWIIVDKARLNASWAFKGPMSDVIKGSSDVKYIGPDESLAMFVRFRDRWDLTLTASCNKG